MDFRGLHDEQDNFQWRSVNGLLFALSCTVSSMRPTSSSPAAAAGSSAAASQRRSSAATVSGGNTPAGETPAFDVPRAAACTRWRRLWHTIYLPSNADDLAAILQFQFHA